jgi:hypothetical protein
MGALNAVASTGDPEGIKQLSKSPDIVRVNAGNLAFSRIFSYASVESRASSEFCCDLTSSGCSM